MISVPSRVTKPLNANTLGSLNNKISEPLNRSTVMSLNVKKQNAENAMPAKQAQQQACAVSAVETATPASNIVDMPVPEMRKLLRKGQKTALAASGSVVRSLKACFGWNVKNAACDIDASAFLVTETGKVAGDSWFVFYGQPESPDGSVVFKADGGAQDRELITIDFGRLNPMVKKIVFVLTINETFEQNLNFNMVKDAYGRILDGTTNQEILSFELDEYYANVTSMTIGELYIHNGQWKFNPVGNGVCQDLAGQCAIYGVEIE